VARFRGELIRENDHGDEDLCPQSEAAALVAEQLRGHYAYQVASASWFRFDGSHWQEIKQLEVDEAITALTYAGAAHLGFSNTYQNGVGALLLKGGNLALGPRPGGLIPFPNGLLDMKAKVLVPTTPENAQTWCLPFEYVPGAQCPVFINWLRNAVDGDEGTVRLLRAFFNALLTGRPDLQRFIHFTGPASTGKSTVGRLAGAIMGPDNCTTTSLKQLETNRFETANIFGKRLVTLEEVDKYGGSVNVLKAMTGQDPLRLERKNVQQSGSFIFQGQVIMASNERFATSDYTSGIERRRVTIEFNRRISPAERVEWERRGGEEAILHPEIPGIILWALELTRDQVSAAFQTMPDRIRKANIDAALFNNPLADWMLECCLPGGRCRVGDGREVMSMAGERVYIDAEEQLYANYLLWCRRSGREQVSLQRFSNTLEEASQQYGANAKKHRAKNGTFMEGLRLRMQDEMPWKDRALAGG
jgi:putative DNA primase/helicase